MVLLNAFCQSGPAPATYATEVAIDPDVASKPTPHISRIMTLPMDTLEPFAPCVANHAGYYFNPEHHDKAC